MNIKYPTWSDLLELWLQQKYSGVPCVIFCSPLADPTDLDKKIDFLQKVLGPNWEVGAEYAIHPCTDEEGTNFIKEAKGLFFALFWDGHKFTKET